MMTLRKDAAGAEAQWKWMQERGSDIESKLFTSLGISGVIVGIMIRRLVSKDKFGEVQTFFTEKDTVRVFQSLSSES